MKRQLSDLEAEQAIGGTVIISKDYMVVGFTTLGDMADLKNCTYREARNLVDDLLDANQNLTGQEFDQLVKNAFQANGWI